MHARSVYKTKDIINVYFDIHHVCQIGNARQVLIDDKFESNRCQQKYERCLKPEVG